jgi:hypothetical protein
VKIEGSPKAYSRTAESGRAIGSYFCPECGSRMYWEHPLDAGQIGIPVGAFAGPSFPLPEVSSCRISNGSRPQAHVASRDESFAPRSVALPECRF